MPYSRPMGTVCDPLCPRRLDILGFKTTGIRLCSSAHNSFGVVVMMVKLRILSPAGERQVSHNPAMPISRRLASAIA
jgi:hypothetical protein